MRHRTMAEAALERLREAIILGRADSRDAAPARGSRPPLGMSISPIREAVRQLEALGLAEHVPHHGAKVIGLDVEELRELFSIRLALETLAVRRRPSSSRRRTSDAARAHLVAFDAARHAGDIARRRARAHRLPLRALRGGAARRGSLRLIRPAWDSLRALPARAARGEGRPAGPSSRSSTSSCSPRAPPTTPTARRTALHDHLELAAEIYAVELKGRCIFAF